jgi:hypothetical protein
MGITHFLLESREQFRAEKTHFNNPIEHRNATIDDCENELPYPPSPVAVVDQTAQAIVWDLTHKIILRLPCNEFCG